MEKLIKKTDYKFYSIDISRTNVVYFGDKEETINKFISVFKLQSEIVEPDNFYKPISKCVNI